MNKSPNNPDDRPLLYGPDNKPLNIGETGPGGADKSAAKLKATKGGKNNWEGALRWMRTHRKKLIAIPVSFVTFALGVYSVRPVLSVASIGPSFPGSRHETKITVALSGFPISRISVRCLPNKIINSGIYTLEFHNFSIEEYDVRSANSGDTFTFTCPLGWTLLTCPKWDIYVWEEAVPASPMVGIPFIVKNGTPVALAQGFQRVFLTTDFPTCAIHRETAIDGTVAISYRWRYLPGQYTTYERVIGTVDDTGGVSWRAAPSGEPIISDPHAGGFKLIATSRGSVDASVFKSAGHFIRQLRVP
jgi:hypothetical protein